MSVSFADSTLPAENSQANVESFPVAGNQGRLLTKVAFEQHRTWLFLISQNRSNLPSIYLTGLLALFMSVIYNYFCGYSFISVSLSRLVLLTTVSLAAGIMLGSQ